MVDVVWCYVGLVVVGDVVFLYLVGIYWFGGVYVVVCVVGVGVVVIGDVKVVVVG